LMMLAAVAAGPPLFDTGVCALACAVGCVVTIE
jgi:hypothetical protein